MKYVALLRGIMPTNPNMRNAKICDVFETIGLKNPRGFLTSGNILFESDEADESALERKIQTALQEKLGLPGLTIVRSETELRALLDRQIFKGYEHAQKTYLTITFLKSPLENPVQASGEYIAVSSREICAVSDNSDGSPAFMTRLKKQCGDDITTRTLQTIERLMGKI